MGPLFTVIARQRCRAALRAKGYSLRQIQEVIHAVDDDSISWAVAENALSVTAIGDGKIIDAIIDFFKSPQGQALLDALLKLLLGLLA
jgi:hypothetical protein